jgi:RNA polymerase sigma-70 factor (ECF subfamily)
VDVTQRLLKLLDEHGARLHRLLARLTLRGDAADDLLQDLFLKLRASNGFAKADDQVAFAVRTAVNLAFDCRRRQARRRDGAALDGDAAGPGSDPLAGLVEREEMDQVLAAIAELPDATRLAVTLRYLERHETDEVARLMENTPHQARALCAKGLAILRERLGEPAQEVSDG